MLIKGGEEDIPRVNATLILSLFTLINSIVIVSGISSLIDIEILGNNKLYNLIFIAPIMALNFILVFYRKHYRKAENNLSKSWAEDRNKNILITISYATISVIALWLTLKFI